MSRISLLTGAFALALPVLVFAQAPSIPSAPDPSEARKAGVERGGSAAGGAAKQIEGASGNANEAKLVGEQKVGEIKSKSEGGLEKATVGLEKARAELLDLNSASKEELEALPGVGEKYAQKIVDARPFERKDQLKKILPKKVYQKVKTFVVAKQAEDKPYDKLPDEPKIP